MSTRTAWRGITTDAESALCWEAAATDPDLDDILVRPIPGYGSYRSNAASAGTDSGGGHVDINLVGLTNEQCRRIETVYRRYGNAAWWRPERSAAGVRYGWQNHLHVLRIDCADLAGPARTQIADYAGGWSGLPIGGRTLRDSGNRGYTDRRWMTIKKTLAKPTNPTPPKEVNVALTAADIKKIWYSNDSDLIKAPTRYTGKAREANPFWTPASFLTSTNDHAYAARIAAEQALSIVKAVAAKMLTAAEVEAAAKAALDAALLDSVDVTGSLSITPKP